jgi:hypothetical protein
MTARCHKWLREVGKAGRIRTGVAWLRAAHPAARRQPRGGSGETRTPTLLVAKQLLGPIELRTHGAPGRTCTPFARFKRPASGSLSYEGDSLEPPGGLEPPAFRVEAGSSSAELRRHVEEGLGFEPRRACESPCCFRDSCHQPNSANPPGLAVIRVWGDRSESNRHHSGHNRAL